MARSGQRRRSTALPVREELAGEDASLFMPRFAPLSDYAIAQLQTLRDGGQGITRLIETSQGRQHFALVQHSIHLELESRAREFSIVPPGTFLRDASLRLIADTTTDPVDRIPTRYAALALSCLADQDLSAESKEADITIAAVAFALSGDTDAAAHMLLQHDIDLDSLPLSSRFSIAIMVPEMRAQLMSAFPTDSGEFRLLNMIEHNAGHFHIQILHEQLCEHRDTLPRDKLDRFLSGLAQKRLTNYAYRSSFDMESRAVTASRAPRDVRPEGWSSRRSERHRAA